MRDEEREEQETAEQSISLLYTPCLFLIKSIYLEAAYELAKSLSKERYHSGKKLAPMGK